MAAGRPDGGERNATAREAGSIVKPPGSMSTSTGTAPARSIAATVATAVCETVNTRSPGATLQASNASSIASVPLPAPTACPIPSQVANAASNPSTSCPRMYWPLASTRAIAASISAFCSKYPARGSVCGIGTIVIAGSDIAGQMAAVIIEGARQAVIEADARRPPGQLAKAAIVGDEIADIDALAVGREFALLETAAAIRPDQRLGQGEERIGLAAADIEREARGVAAERSAQKRLDRIIDIQQLTALFAAPPLEGGAFQRAAQPDPEEILPRILDP